MKAFIKVLIYKFQQLALFKVVIFQQEYLQKYDKRFCLFTFPSKNGNIMLE